MARHVIGPVAAFPVGTHRVVSIGRAQIGVFNVGGQLYALPNVCTHQFGPLCEGPVGGTMACSAATAWRHEWVHDGEIVTCPWHGLEFEIATGQCLASRKVRLRTHAVSVEDNLVTVTT